MTTLPQEIHNDQVLFAQNEELRSLRAELTTATSQMESGSYSIKKVFAGLIESINRVIDSMTAAIEVAVVPEDEFQNFLDGLTTLDEYGSFDIIAYYNGLKKMRLVFYGATVALSQLQDVPVKPITPSVVQENGILDSLDTKEFLEQGAENPVFEAQQSYQYYVIVDGDTLQTIASKVYDGDINRWPEIAQANSLRDSDLLDNVMAGETIKIPVDAAGAANIRSNNLVYETFFDGLSQVKLDNFNYGRDIYLFEKRFQVSSTGDLKRAEGTKCLVQNVQARFDNTVGALNPLNPTWGLQPSGDTASVPFVIMLDRTLTDMESQASEDPRVLNAAAQRKKIRIEGDAVFIDIEMDLIGGKNFETTFDIRNVL